MIMIIKVNHLEIGNGRYNNNMYCELFILSLNNFLEYYI